MKKIQLLDFCLSNALPNPLIGSARPRVASVVESDDSFGISRLEAPVEAPSQFIAGWVEALRRA